MSEENNRLKLVPELPAAIVQHAKATPSDMPEATPVSEELDTYLRANFAVDRINAALGDARLPTIPEDYKFKVRDRQAVTVAMHAAFELIGGVPGLMLWGSTNPDKFYPIWAKMAAMDDLGSGAGGTTINFISPIPEIPQDQIFINKRGDVVNPSDEGFDELPE